MFNPTNKIKMKNLLILLLTLMSFLSYSQHYKLYSNVWALNCEEGGEHMFIPKEGGD